MHHPVCYAACPSCGPCGPCGNLVGSFTGTNHVWPHVRRAAAATPAHTHCMGATYVCRHRLSASMLRHWRSHMQWRSHIHEIAEKRRDTRTVSSAANCDMPADATRRRPQCLRSALPRKLKGSRCPLRQESMSVIVAPSGHDACYLARVCLGDLMLMGKRRGGVATAA